MLQDPALLCLFKIQEEIKSISRDIIKEMKEIVFFHELDMVIQSCFEKIQENYFNKAKQQIQTFINI